jgi:caa(3)-type oxidase subunit IV
MSKKIKAQHESHEAHGGHDDHRPDVGLYLKVFGALMVLTAVTVIISKFHLPRPQAIALGLLVAGTKAALVGAIFMHLWGEKKLIHKFLWVTVGCGAILVIGIVDSHLTAERRLERAPVADQHPDEGGEKASISETVTLPPAEAKPAAKKK